MAAKKLKHYFQEQSITVVCTAPLSEKIGSKDASGRVAKWAKAMVAHNIDYKPRTSIKSQALADFLVDWAELQYIPPAPDSSHWYMHFDGSKQEKGLGAGIVLTSPKRDKLEYEALIHGLKLAKDIGIKRIMCFGDSDLVVQQVSGDWDTKDVNMRSYRFFVNQLCGFFNSCEFHHISRTLNDATDTLSKLGSMKAAIPPGVSLEHLYKPSIKPDPSSNSIFVPTNPNAPAEQVDAGAEQADPGAGQTGSGAKMPPGGAADPGAEQANPGDG
jgi:ribonuclease HI